MPPAEQPPDNDLSQATRETPPRRSDCEHAVLSNQEHQFVGRRRRRDYRQAAVR
jgi:hypothetical protein